MLLRRFKSSNAWLARQKRDPFVKQRSGEFRSRSAFKLLELDSQYKFLKPGSVVVDLGAAPGGWSEAAIRRVFPALITEGQEQDVVMQSSTDGSNAGRVIAVDIIPMEPIMGVHAIQGDFLSQATRQSVERAVGADRQVDVVISDMCKNISGNRMSDVEASLELCYAAFTFARDFLPPSSSEKPLQGVMV
jgi:23S rRNA (uridine2552-2'-O)-methyltransferase